MKKIIFVLMLTVVLVLSACTADQQSELTTSKEASQQWTYKLITQVCAYDTDSNDIVCKDPATKDESMLANIIGSQAADGYELDEIVSTPKGKSFAQTFIFRKAYVAPEPEVTEEAK